MPRTLLIAACAAGLGLSGQPRFPQHSTGMPSVPSPLPRVENHITNLSGSIAGRPMPSRPGVRPIYPVPVLPVGGGWFPQPAVAPVPVIQPMPVFLVNQQNTAPAPVLVVNPDYKPEVAKPVMREYSNISNPYENFTPNAPKVFLIALKDGTLRQAVAFWAEDGKLHFVQPDHKQDSVAMASLDRDGTKRFNSERGLDIKLPE